MHPCYDGTDDNNTRMLWLSFLSQLSTPDCASGMADAQQPVGGP